MTAPRRLRPAAFAVALVLCAAAFAAAQPPPPPPPGQRPGETGPPPPPPASGAGAPGATAVVRGHVTSADGRPLREAQVKFTAPSLRQPRTATTDADGAYEINELRADSYAVTAGKTGFTEMEFGQKRATYPGTRLRVADGETVEKIDFILPRSGAITGRVSDESGDPIEGATVSLLGVQYAGGRRTLAQISRRTTNDQGRFRLFGVQPGQYIVSASTASVGPQRLPGYATTYFPGSTSVADAQVITVTAGDDQAAVEIRMLPGLPLKISGTISDSRGEPYFGRVLLAGSERSGALAMPPVQAVASGTFEIPNIAPGEYVLQAIQRDALGGEFATQFVTVIDSDVAGISMRTGTGSTVNGHITFDGGAAGMRPQDFQFLLLQTDFDLGPVTGTYRAKINDDWTFEYVGLFGPLLIRPTGGSEWLVKSVHAGGVDVTDTALSFGRREQSLTDVEVVLTNHAAAITGSITDSRGQAAPACTVIVFPVDRTRWTRHGRFVKAARCNADGTFNVRGLPASGYFVAAVDRLQGSERAGEWQEPAFLEALSAGAMRVSVTDGQTATVTAKLMLR